MSKDVEVLTPAVSVYDVAHVPQNMLAQLLRSSEGADTVTLHDVIFEQL